MNGPAQGVHATTLRARYGSLRFIGSVFRAMLLIFIIQTPAAAAERLILGLHPYLPAQQVHAAFSPIAREIERRTGMPVVLSIAKDYETHILDVGEGRVDLAFIGPVPYVNMVRRYGPFPLLARLEAGGRPYFNGVIFVAEHSPVHRLQDLRGKRFAFGDRHSTMGHVIPLFMLERAGVPLDSLAGHEHVGDHENIVLSVLVGDFDAGSVKDDMFERFRSRGLRGLAVSPRIPEHLFLARQTLAPATVELLRSTLLSLSRDEPGRQALRAIRGDATGLTTVSDRDYDDLRSILDALSPGGRLP